MRFFVHGLFQFCYCPWYIEVILISSLNIKIVTGIDKVQHVFLLLLLLNRAYLGFMMP